MIPPGFGPQWLVESYACIEAAATCIIQFPRKAAKPSRVENARKLILRKCNRNQSLEGKQAANNSSATAADKMAGEPVSRILFGALLCSSAPRQSFL